jgi:N-acetylmuramoyl-L-alanine amidase
VPVAIRPAHAPIESGRDIIIAVDAGHGGVDPGASGRRGTREKDVVLEVAKALAARINEGARHEGRAHARRRLLHQPAGAAPAPPRVRRRICSCRFHADSIANPDVRDRRSTCCPDRGATSEAARWLAERENAADLKGRHQARRQGCRRSRTCCSICHRPRALLRAWFAADTVLRSLDQVGEVRKPRVQQAGFVVLKSPDIPSMLVETAFISNREDERKLAQPAHAPSSRTRSSRDTAVFSGQCARRHPGSRPRAGVVVRPVDCARSTGVWLRFASANRCLTPFFVGDP